MFYFFKRRAQIPWNVKITMAASPPEAAIFNFSIKGIVPLHVPFCTLSVSLHGNISNPFSKKPFYRSSSSQLVYKFICKQITILAKKKMKYE